MDANTKGNFKRLTLEDEFLEKEASHVAGRPPMKTAEHQQREGAILRSPNQTLHETQDRSINTNSTGNSQHKGDGAS